MYLLYIDDSGAIHDHQLNHAILAGFSIFETQTHWIDIEIEKIMQAHLPFSPQLEIHSSDMFKGTKMWRGIPEELRVAIMLDVLRLISNSYNQNANIILFGAVINKGCDHAKEIADLEQYMFTQVISRFDKFLQRKYIKNNKHSRGIAILDKSTSERTMQTWARSYKTIGHQWGLLRNFSEVPLFLDSKMSRLIQLADLIAYSMFRHFERGDSRFYDIIKDCFDRSSGQTHGLHVLA
jgi:hypothetical protein